MKLSWCCILLIFVILFSSIIYANCPAGCTVTPDGCDCSSQTPQQELQGNKNNFAENNDPEGYSNYARENPTYGEQFKAAETPPYKNGNYNSGDGGDIPDEIKELLGWPMEEHLDDGWYKDDIVRAYQPVGYRLGLRYSVSKAQSFRIDRYEFKDIIDSDFYVKMTGKLGVADVTSAKEHNEFKWFNPIAHVIDPENTEFSTSSQDGDALSDLVEKRLGFEGNNGDSDGDGLSDSQEFLTYGTNPMKAESGVIVNDKELTDKEYVELITSVYSEWIKTGEQVVLGIDTESIPLMQLRHYKDSDGDLISDYVEAINGFDYNKKDMDGDGLSDGYELSKSATNPMNPDTDDDGISDSTDAFPLVNNVQMTHMMPEIADTYITVVADENERFIYDLSNYHRNDFNNTISFRTDDEIEITIGNVNAMMQFQTHNSSFINMTKIPEGYEIIMYNTTLVTAGLDEVTCSNRTIVTLYDKIICMTLTPIGRYTWHGTFANYPFSFYVQDEPFDLCLRKNKTQVFSKDLIPNSGVVDFINKSMAIKGIVEFEKPMTMSEYYTDIIDSNSKNNFYNISFDSKLNLFESGFLNNTISEVEEPSVLHSSFFSMINRKTATFFDLLKKTTTPTSSISFETSFDNATFYFTDNVMTANSTSIFMAVAENSPEYHLAIKEMRDFRR